MWTGVRVQLPDMWVAPRRRTVDAAHAWVRLVETVADELRAGATVQAAWQAAQRETGVVVAADVGYGLACTQIAVRERLPEVSQLGLALEVAHSSGASLDETLTHVADALRARIEDRALVEQELSATRATVVVLACLPLVGALMSSALGADSLRWLTGSGLGRLCLTGGLVLQAMGVWWLRRMVARVAR